ncbi:FCD domain-containing protein [Arthrobacter sp. FB24]|uniref:FCD domain-containing protein n=1 Tax=Arthrobacter sp. (strain FB24) TaxID=290399 RepID=UPI0005BDFC9C|nr:FCD domain-containing protein [Arthrobacter sp. FB24]
MQPQCAGRATRLAFDGVQQALAEHRAIFTALESHDATAVTDAMASHMDTASRRLLAGYDAAR